MSDGPREELCPDCLAFPGEHDQRVIIGSLTGPPVTTWHKKDCPQYLGPPEPDEEPAP